MTALSRGRRLGVDVGKVRVGVAISDPDGILATPLVTVPRDLGAAPDAVPGDIAELVRLVGEHEAVQIVVGLPVRLNGTEGLAAIDIRAYAGRLAAAVGEVPVALTDERMSTVVATRRLAERGVRGKRQRAVVDQAAAVEILQSWLDAQREAEMIDELDLAFDEHAERGKPRHRRGRGGKKSSGKSAVAFLMAFILLAVLGGGAYFGYTKIKGFFVAADYDGPGTEAVQVTIAPGSTLTDMGNTLVDKDVVKSTKAFTNAAAKDPRSKNIQGGTYHLRKQMSAKYAVAALLDPKSRITSGVTIPEGKTALQTYALLAKATKIPLGEFVAAGKNLSSFNIPAFWFNRRDNLPAQKSIEGFLFPDTYQFDPKMTAQQILQTMVDRFMAQVQDLGLIDTVQNNLAVSPFEALVVASLAQAEAGNAADLSKVARVAYNRAYKAKIPLQFDVTTNYWLELNGKAAKSSGQLTAAELNDPRNPYSTTKKVGLPIGPIDNPGRAALQGAMQPASGNWLFFVVIDKSGRSAFAATNAEHNANKLTACRNGIKLSDCPK